MDPTPPQPPDLSGDAPNFGQSPEDDRSNRAPMIIGVAVTLALLMAFIAIGRLARGPSAPAPDPYIKSLQLSGFKLSQAQNFVGGNVTYLEGRLTNAGERTVNAATVRVIFKNSLGEVSQAEVLPL